VELDVTPIVQSDENPAALQFPSAIPFMLTIFNRP
jgi:hypothetical protein